MERIRHLLAASAALLCAPLMAQQPSIAHFESINDWRIAARQASDALSAPALTARFSAFGREFDLALEPNMRVEAMFEDGLSARAYRGQLRDVPGSWARLVITDDGIAGLIFDGAALFGVEHSPDTGATMFRAEDVIVPAGTMSCGMHAPAADAAAMFAELTTHTPAIGRAAGATLNLDLGIVADPELSAIYADPQAEMLTRVNNVDGIYSEQLGVQLSVARVDVFDDSATDPFSDTTVSEDLLEELSYFRADTPEQDAQGLTHLFTGRDLDGSTVGVAYIGAVCAQRSAFNPTGPSFGVGLTQTNFGPAGAFLESLIAAHEIGHNFGAPHDGGVGDECESAPATGFIMAASLDPAADQFSQCSIDVITAALPAATCLSPIASIDAAISAQSSVTNPLTETQFGYVVSVTNGGAEAAAATSADLTFDSALTVVSVTPQAGTCGPAQANVSCELGDIPASSTRTIDVVLQADAAGDFAISGSVSTANDIDAGNDSFADSITVSPASDLAIVTSAQTLTENLAETIQATLENRSGVAATNITVTGTWSAGLDVSSAAFAGNACSIANGSLQFECQIANLAGLASGTLSMTLSATQAGSEVITLIVSALESDPNTANNSSNLSINVEAAGAPPAASAPSDPVAQDSGGGGSLGPLALLGLLGAWRNARRRRREAYANFS